MKTLYPLSIIFAGLVASLPALAQISSDVQSLFYRGYLTASKAPWEQALKKIESDATLNETRKLTAITEAQTGLLVYALANQDEATFDKVADGLEENLETLLEQDEHDARSLAKLAQLYGATIAFAPWKAMYLGPKSQSLVDKALKQDLTSPEAWVQRANSFLFTPAMFGGDVDEAVKCFQKAVQYYEAQSDTTNNWRYLDALAWLGQAYQQAERPAEAVEVFNKALDVESDFGWVKHKLLPQATAQASSK